MITQTKRKNVVGDEDIKGNAKKRKHDILWLSEGLSGSDPFGGNSFKKIFLVKPLRQILLRQQMKNTKL